MHNVIRMAYKKIRNKLRRVYRRVYRSIKKPPEYCLIHIGKCGGSTLRKAIAESEHYSDIDIVHIRKPKFNKRTKYIIVARDPIKRCISAFNWRYKLVVEDQIQRNRFPGEFKILQKYKNISTLAEKLYTNCGNLDHEVSKEFEKIHHLRERIEFYLREFLETCPKSSIVAVLMTETLSLDIEKVFKVPQNRVGYEKFNKGKKSEKLSQLGHDNLVRYIRRDYDSLIRAS